MLMLETKIWYMIDELNSYECWMHQPSTSFRHNFCYQKVTYTPSVAPKCILFLNISVNIWILSLWKHINAIVSFDNLYLTWSPAPSSDVHNFHFIFLISLHKHTKIWWVTDPFVILSLKSSKMNLIRELNIFLTSILCSLKQNFVLPPCFFIFSSFIWISTHL